MDIVVALSYAVVVSATLLFILTCWHWYDTNVDWAVAQYVSNAHLPVNQQARGSMRLAWFILMDGALYAALAALTWLTRDIVVNPRYYMVWSRAVLLLFIGMEIVKILSERMARIAVFHAAALAREKEQTDHHRERA